MHRSAQLGARLAAAALLVSPTVAHAQELDWSGSLGYATGTYMFSEPFRSFSLWNTLSLSSGRVDIGATLPIVAQNGSVISFVAGTPLPTGGPENGTLAQRKRGQTIPARRGPRRSGMTTNTSAIAYAAMDQISDSMSVSGSGSYETHVADPILSLSVTAYQGAGFVKSLSIDGAVKPPLASVASGVGTGAWDYSSGVSMTTGVGRTLLFANATWWVLGDMSDLELKDALFYGLSVGRSVGEAWTVLASANASTPIIDGTDPPISTHLLVSRRTASGKSLNVGVGVGLTESAAALTVSLGWTTRLFGKRH